MPQQLLICSMENRSSALSFPSPSRREPYIRHGSQIVGGLRGLLISPTTVRKIFWDLLSTAVIAYDLLILPLDAFGVNQRAWATNVGLATTCFWTVDLGLSFLFGYHREDGLIEMRPKQVAIRYLSTWFPFDLAILSLDWSLFIFGSTSDEAVSAGRVNRAIRFFRAAKFLRLVRLVRVLKLATLYEELCEFILSASMMTFMNVARMMVGLAIFVHYIACAWYFVGTTTAHEHPSWISDWLNQEASSEYLYVIAFHWSLAQFLPAPCNDHPRNFYERLFTVFVLLTGFVLFSSAIGSITAMITQSRQAAYKRLRENDVMRRFFADNNVSPQLGNRITHFLSQSRKRKARVTEKDVPIFATLPPSLRQDLHYQVNSERMRLIPFFDLLDEVHQPTVMTICDGSVQEVVSLKGDEPFHYGSKGSCVRIVLSGTFLYSKGRVNFDDHAQGVARSVAKGTYVSEAALWSDWVHQGLMRAFEGSVTLNVEVQHLHAAVIKHQIALSYCRDYSAMYMNSMREAVDADSYADDLFHAFSDSGELMDWGLESGRESFENMMRPARVRSAGHA